MPWPSVRFGKSLTCTQKDTLVYDRMCKLSKSLSQSTFGKRFKFQSVDLWHSSKHSKTCANSPLNVRKLELRIRNVNTSICEQTFSWFRGYAATFNSMSSAHHRFMVLNYCKRHNDCMDVGNVNHLNMYSKHSTRKACHTKPKLVRKRPASSYQCSKQPQDALVSAKRSRPRKRPAIK